MDNKVKIILTNQSEGKVLSQEVPVSMDTGLFDEEFKIVNLYDQMRYQVIDGFGGAFTEAAAVTLQKMDMEQQEKILHMYFDPAEGLGYTFCRTHINSCDFSLGNYSYDDHDGDVSLERFSIERDKQALIPMIKRAKSIAPNMKIFASPWSPPYWMKDTRRMNEGGKLLPEYYDAWARYLAKYIIAYREQGIDLWGITMQNEANAKTPWDSCLYTAEEERDFIKNYLGPTLKREGLGHIKIMFWDHNRERVLERAQVVFSDPDAACYTDGIAVHWYTGAHFNALSMVHECFPDKIIRFTEGCAPFDPTFSKLSNGEWYAHDIIGCMNNWVSSWTDWNLILDEQGGPNHVSNWCDAPVICDTRQVKVILESSYYYLAHFSRYIKPGAVRVGSTSFTCNLETLAVVNPDGQQVCVVLNRSEDDIDFILRYNMKGAKILSPAHSIMTLLV